jgi:hypothetical protein
LQWLFIQLAATPIRPTVFSLDLNLYTRMIIIIKDLQYAEREVEILESYYLVEAVDNEMVDVIVVVDTQ